MKISYNIAEAAEMIGYSERTLKQAIADGKLIARYANSKAVIRHDELDDWSKSMSMEPPTK